MAAYRSTWFSQSFYTAPQSLVSSRSPSSSSSSSGSSDGSFADFGVTDDALGLKMLGFYAPYLEGEMERLFTSDRYDNKSSSGSSSGSGSPQMQIKSVWEDFDKNGQETNLDELDRLFLGMDAGEAIYGTQMEASRSPSPPLMSVADLVQCTTAQFGSRNPGESLMQDILTKAHLIDILREREQLQRSARNVKKIISSGSTVTSSKSKTATGKVCVFCRNNGEAESTYSSHQLKDPEGNVTCPVLYIYTCPICGANGKQSHTIKYCPYNTGDVLSTKSVTKTARNAAGKRIGPGLLF